MKKRNPRNGGRPLGARVNWAPYRNDPIPLPDGMPPGFPPQKEVFRQQYKRAIEVSVLDPTNEHTCLAKCIHPLVFPGSADTPGGSGVEDPYVISAQRSLGKKIGDLLRAGSGPELKRVFNAILRMMERKNECGTHRYKRHRNTSILDAAYQVARLVGRMPTRAEVKKFAIKHADKYPEMPGEEDTRSWARLWTNAGLDSLPVAKPKCQASGNER